MAQNYYVSSVTVRKREGKVGWYAHNRDGSGTKRLRNLKTRNLTLNRPNSRLDGPGRADGTAS